MKYKDKKIIIVVLICVLSVAMCNITFAHSGRTDSSGGHKDKNNVSGLGSYHYHCGGHPAHLHENGVCPYSSSQSLTTKKSNKTTSTSGSKGSSSSTKSTSTTTYSNNETKEIIPITIEAESIKINEGIKEIKVGDSKQLSATVLPENTTNKEFTWKSSDEEVVKVSSTGTITAIGEGKAYIMVSTSNKKTDSITILVKEEEKKTVNNIVNNETNEKKENNINTSVETNSKDSNPLGPILVLGILSGGGYLGYRRYKNNKS